MSTLQKTLSRKTLSTIARQGAEIQLNARAETTSTAIDLLSTPSDPLRGMDVIPYDKGRYSQLSKLGVQIWGTDPQAHVKFMKAGDASWVDENSNIPEGTLSYGDFGEIDGKLAVQFKVSQELLGNNLKFDDLSGFVYELMEKEIFKSIDRALFAKIVEELETQTAVTTWDTGDADKALTQAEVVEFERQLAPISEGGQLQILTASDVKAALKQNEVVATSGRFIYQFDQIADIPAFSSSYVTDQHVIIGDFSNFFVKIPKSLDILIDPITYGDEGSFRIVASGFYQVGSVDDTAFRVLKNVDIA